MKKSIILFSLALLSLTACQQTENSESPTPTESSQLNAQIKYEPVVIDGLTFYETNDEKGFLLDLDGDGKEEQLYLSEAGIYINNELTSSFWHTKNGAESQPWESLWLVDIDTSDPYINLIFKDGGEIEVMAWYDGSLKTIEYDNFYHNAFTSAEYQGDGTFIIQSYNIPLLYQSCYRPVEFAWNAESGMKPSGSPVIIAETAEDTETEDGQWRLISDLKLYAEPDPSFSAENTLAKSGQKIYPLKMTFPDNEHCWIYFESEDGTQGWIYAEYNKDGNWIINQETDASEVIDGYSTVGIRKYTIEILASEGRTIPAR